MIPVTTHAAVVAGCSFGKSVRTAGVPCESSFLGCNAILVYQPITLHFLQQKWGMSREGQMKEVLPWPCAVPHYCIHAILYEGFYKGLYFVYERHSIQWGRAEQCTPPILCLFLLSQINRFQWWWVPLGGISCIPFLSISLPVSWH